MKFLKTAFKKIGHVLDRVPRFLYPNFIFSFKGHLIFLKALGETLTRPTSLKS